MEEFKNKAKSDEEKFSTIVDQTCDGECFSIKKFWEQAIYFTAIFGLMEHPDKTQKLRTWSLKTFEKKEKRKKSIGSKK